MAVQILSLASGQLKGTPIADPANKIYTSPTTPTPLTTIIKSIRLVNTHTAAVTIDLYFLKSGGVLVTDKRLISPQGMTITPGAMAIDESRNHYGLWRSYLRRRECG